MSRRRIDTASELRSCWQTIAHRLARDLRAIGSFATDPVGTLRELGYDVGPEAAAVLVRALPS